MAASTRAHHGGPLRHRSPQLVLLVIGAAFLVLLVVLAMLSLAGVL